MTTTTTIYSEPNITNLADILTYGNTVSGNNFILYFIIGFWIVIFLLTKAFGSERSVVVASFICALVSFFLATASLVSFNLVLIFGILTALGAVLNQ